LPDRRVVARQCTQCADDPGAVLLSCPPLPRHHYRRPNQRYRA
jgi:hypothetical protein